MRRHREDKHFRRAEPETALRIQADPRAHGVASLWQLAEACLKAILQHFPAVPSITRG